MAALALVRPRHVESVPVRIRRKRVYMLPTGFGLFLGTMLAAMLVGGLNYNNNPALLLVFLLAGIAHNSLVHAHLILSGINLQAIHADPVFAGQSLQLKLRFDADGSRARPGLELLVAGNETRFSLDADEQREVSVDVATAGRGWHELPRLRLSTIRPLGLARSWCWMRPQARLLVYPMLDAHAPELPQAVGDGDSPRTRSHGEQPHHLREYRAGDMQRQIAWKASARADRLLVREYESAVARDIAIDWRATAGQAYESRISRMAQWVVEAERSGSRYSMSLPNQLIAAMRGAEHRHHCLRALALLPDG